MPVISLMLFLLLSIFLMAMIQVHALEIAFAKLGLSPEATLLILLGSLIGGGINLPLFKMKAQQPGHLFELPDGKRVWELFQPAREGYTIIAVNVGGGLIPVGLSLYFMAQQAFGLLQLVVVLPAMIALSYKLSRPVPGVGIGMPILIVPLASVFFSLWLEPDHAAQLAYVSGVLGVLIGADLLRLKSVVDMGVPLASIGGAGTFDGIFMTGIIAALLA